MHTHPIRSAGQIQSIHPRVTRSPLAALSARRRRRSVHSKFRLLATFEAGDEVTVGLHSRGDAAAAVGVRVIVW